MRSWLPRLLPFAEFLLVIGIGFGLFIAESLLVYSDFLAGQVPKDPLASTNQELYSIIQYELFALLMIGMLLASRGWRWRDFSVHITWLLSAAALALLVVDTLTYSLLYYAVFEPLFPSNAALYQIEPVASLDWKAILLLSIVNGFYEELLVVGYICLVIAPRWGIWPAVLLSTAIRLLYHLYQGPIAFISIAPMGILFAYLFVRYRQLWPMILAHIIMDIIGLLPELCLDDSCRTV